MNKVHLSDWSSQPHIRIACDQSWTTPDCSKSFEDQLNNDTGIYEAEDGGRLYTFEGEKVSCEKCLNWMKNNEGIW